MTTQRQAFSLDALVQVIEQSSIDAKQKLANIQSRKSAISIGDMFDMQMLMNHLSQMSEMTTAVVNASNSSVVSMARNIKG